MPAVHKVQNEDGSYTIMADGQPVRSTLDAFEADEVIRSLSYLAAEDDDQPPRLQYA